MEQKSMDIISLSNNGDSVTYFLKLEVTDCNNEGEKSLKFEFKGRI